MAVYRWLPSTFFKNIYWLVYDFVIGIKNIIRWIPIIWSDIDYDWEPLAKIMEYKLRRMSKCLKDGVAVDSEKYAKQTLICAELLKRLQADETIEPINRANVLQHYDRMEGWQRMLGRYIGKYFMSWWD